MRRLAIILIVSVICILLTGLFQPALNPRDFTGKWYSSADQSVYLFQEGLIFCSRHSVALSETEFLSGAYSFGKDSVFLFAEGIAGLEQERQLYLVKRGEESCLCENRDGSGQIYFIRYNK